MKKLSIIRNDLVLCPYRLPIPQACSSVGNAISTMEPAEKIEDIKKNKNIYITQQNGEPCMFANVIMKNFDSVDCNYGDSASGEHSNGYLPSSPLYPQTFIGTNINPEVREDRSGTNNTDPRLSFESTQKGIDVPFGLYSIFSNRSNEQSLIKLAETTNKISNIEDKLTFLRNKYYDTLQLIVPKASIVKLNDRQLEKLLFIIDDWTK